jgi:hypothetical protein
MLRRENEADARHGARTLPWWTLNRGEGPIVGTAIHNGHEVSSDVAERMALGERDRLREEDPFTGFLIEDLPNRIVCHQSRFAVDLNRARDNAVYVRPEQAWGLQVWTDEPTEGLLERCLVMHDQYYAMLEATLCGLAQSHGRFVLLDMHSYNHRRDGPHGETAAAALAPEINIGTCSMDTRRWRDLLDTLIDALRSYDYRGRHLDVRENIAFEGRGEQARFVHARFPKTGCAIAVEFKKFFMDEWSGEPDRKDLEALRDLVNFMVPVLTESLRRSA